MVDRDVANAITIAMIANVIEVTVILFITFFSFIGESVCLVFPDSVCATKELFTCYFDPSTRLTELKAKLRTNKRACWTSFA